MRRYLTFSALVALSFLFIPAASWSQYSIKSYTLNVDDDGDYPLQIDINRDGVPDFLGGSQNLVSANGAYSYKSAAAFRAQGTGYGDFNNDGIPDYVTGSVDYLYVYLGDGKGGYTLWQTARGQAAAQYIVADFNGDGRQDIASLVLLNSSSTTGGGFEVDLYLNNGNGFDNAKTVFQTTFPAGNQGGWPRSEPGLNMEPPFFDFALGDFDADGHADLMLRTLRSSWNTPEPIPVTFIRVLYGDGHGNFTTKTVTSGSTLDQVTVAEMNNDGVSDIVAVNGDQATVYYGHADRTFSSASIATPGAIHLQPMLVDVNSDGLKDIVYIATCPSTDTCPDVPAGATPTGIITLIQSAAHTFTSTGFTQVQNVFTRGFIGDLNHDGRLDVALHTGPLENDNYQAVAQLYVITNTRSVARYCPAPAGTGFHICTPAAGTTVASPVSFNFSASSIYPIRKLEVWVDGTKRSETWNSVGQQAFSRESLALSSGKHKVSLVSGAYDGSVRKTNFSLTVK